MLGAIIGDIVGSIYEFDSIRTKDFPFFQTRMECTDDSILTFATTEWILRGGDAAEFYCAYAMNYPCPMGSYGGMFQQWVIEKARGGAALPYNSCGNGSAMRVAPVGWAFDSEEEVMEVMEASQVYHLKSLDVTYENGGEDKEVSLIDVLGDEDKSFSEIENRDFFEKMFQKLDDVEREIIIGRFFKQKTQMKIAEELNISQMTVSRIEKKVLSKIKKEYERTMSEG